MSAAKPSISVVMPVWNGEKYLREAVESILCQTFGDFEFLILDDGSTDATPEILMDYANRDARIRVIPLAHEGIVVALNRGVTEARADWIARMDCDDVAHQERFARQWAVIQERPAAVLCHTQIRIVGDPRYVTPSGRFPRTQALLAMLTCVRASIVHPTVMFRKEVFLACGGYRPDERHAEDFGLWGRLMELGEVVGVSEPMLDFRVHGSSISRQVAELQTQLSKRIAVRHCEQYLRLDNKSALRAYAALRGDICPRPILDWIWLVFKCVPRLRWQSVELWLWIARRTLARMLDQIRLA